MQPADEMKQPAVPFDDRSVNKLKQLRLEFVLKNSVLFSLPEPWLIGELIVYPWSGVRRPSIRSQWSNIFFSETAWPIKAKFYVEPPWVGGTIFCCCGIWVT